MARPMLSDRCLSVLSCLSVTLAYWVKTAGWIKMKLDMEVGLGPGHIVLEMGPSSPLSKGAQLPIFGKCLLWPNGYMDQDVGPGDIVLDGDPAPLPKKGAQQPPNFRPVYTVSKTSHLWLAITLTNMNRL